MTTDVYREYNLNIHSLSHVMRLSGCRLGRASSFDYIRNNLPITSRDENHNKNINSFNQNSHNNGINRSQTIIENLRTRFYSLNWF